MQNYRLCNVAEDGRRIEFDELVCRDDGHAVHLAKRLRSRCRMAIASFSGWNAKDADADDDERGAQDTRLIAMDAATVAAIRLQAPEFEAAYLDDNLPRWFQRQLDYCTNTAERVADCTDAAFVETLSALLGRALGAVKH